MNETLQPTIQQAIDFDLHGIVGIRLLDAGPEETTAVARQLGPIQKPLNREPDIIIRFVDRLALAGPIRYLGLNDVGFTEDAFLVLHSKHKTKARVRIPMEQVGQKRCEIVCERGLPAVPYLIAILNMTVLARGALPMHASAFTYHGTGAVVTGWAKGGKTETLLAFMANGASYVGDEWIYFDCEGRQIYGIPEPIRVWDWHLAELPRYRALLSGGQRVRLRALGLLARGFEMAATNGGGKMLRRSAALVRRQLYVHLPPQKTFGADSCTLTGSPDKIIFVASHEAPQITVERIDSQEIARRMVYSLQEEQQHFISCYLKFRFAFPAIQNELIERSEQLQREALTRVLTGKESYVVYHPYPVSIPSLYEAVEPLLEPMDG